MNTQRIVPVFQVANLDSAIPFYIQTLGFSEDFRFGRYAGIKLGCVNLHLSEQLEGQSEYKKPLGSGIAYIFCDSVDAYFEQIKAKGVTVKYSPSDAAYGMREFMVADLDGNYLAFGTEIPET